MLFVLRRPGRIAPAARQGLACAEGASLRGPRQAQHTLAVDSLSVLWFLVLGGPLLWGADCRHP